MNRITNLVICTIILVAAGVIAVWLPGAVERRLEEKLSRFEQTHGARADSREASLQQSLREVLEAVGERLGALEARLEEMEESLRFEPWALPLSAELQEYTYRRCRQAGVPVELVFAVMELESGFQTDITGRNTNGTVDTGLMMINSVNWNWLADLGLDVHTPEGNIDAGIYLLQRMYQQGYATDEVLAAYVAGEAGMRRGGGRWYARRVAEIVARQGVAEAGAG